MKKFKGLSSKKLKEVVTIICYGQKETKTRQEAIDDFYEAMLCSEGSEHERYENIFFQLMNGKMECNDQEGF